MENIKVSVCIQTFNHEKYIEKCIESVINQKTNFEYEIIIGEDSSGDNTYEICKSYFKKFEKIKLIRRDRKDVIYINNKPTGRFNFFENLRLAKGDFIALLDGDDYWTDNLKLQKQFDSMFKSKNVSLSFHNTKIQNSTKRNIDKTFRYQGTTKILSTKDLLKPVFIHTSSVFFKNILDDYFFNTFKFVPSIDWALFCYLTKFGNAIHIDEYMSVYNKNEFGVTKTHNNLNLLKGRLFMYELLNIAFNKKYHSEILEKQQEELNYYLNKNNYIKHNIHIFNLLKKISDK